MSGLFENLAATDDSAIIASRQATAVAHKRARDRFGAFLANATTDRPARLALIEDELTTIVSDVVGEYGGDAQKIEAAIKHSLGVPGAVPGAMGAPGGGAAPMGAAGMGQDPNGAACPSCGGAMQNGQCPTCGGQGGAAVGGAANAQGGAYGLTHSMPQGPSTGPVMAAMVEAAGGYCDKCQTWKHKGDCTCDSDTGDDDAEDNHEPGDDAKSDKPDKASDNPFESAVHTARRPKMCPYHSEVVDISLGAGDPQSGFNAMSAHAWGEQHCKGGFEGACNFRPAMVTQKFWDDKQQEYDERREQRQLDRQLPPDASQLSIDTEPIMHAEPLPDEPGKEGVTDIDGELADAPSAVGSGEMAVAASTHKEAEALKTVDLPTGNDTALGGPSPKIDKGNSGNQGGWSLEPIDTEMDGSPHPSEEQDPTAKADYNKSDFLDQTDAVNTSETLPTNKGDAGYNTDKNIKVPDKAQWTGTGDQANPVTRQSESALHGPAMGLDPGYQADNYQVCPACGGDHADPRGVCPHCGHDATVDTNDFSQQLGQGLMPHGAARDPEKNPIRELLEEYEGFLMPNQVQSALKGWMGD